MGKPMAKNLLKAGYEVVVADKFAPKNVEEVVAAGARAGASNRDVGAQADVLITMVPNSPNVKEALFGEDGAAGTMRKGTVVLDCSSINPIASREIAAELEKLGIDMLDCPVSGGEPKAIDGTLAFMVGGKQSVFDAYKPRSTSQPWLRRCRWDRCAAWSQRRFSRPSGAAWRAVPS